MTSNRGIKPKPAQPGETWKQYMGRMTDAYLRIPDLPPSKPKRKKAKRG